MHLPISISCDRGRGKKTVETKALVDSSAGGTFINQNFARTKGFRLQNLEHPITVYNVDGTLNKRGTIVHFVKTNVKIGGRTQEIWFLVSGLGRQKVILGFPWLEKENPAIDWKKATLEWPPEERIQKRKYRLQSQNHKHIPRPIIEEIYDDDDQFNSPVNPISNDEPNLILPMNQYFSLPHIVRPESGRVRRTICQSPPDYLPESARLRRTLADSGRTDIVYYQNRKFKYPKS